MGKSKIEKILLIKLRAIGDVVLSTIVLENLRAAYPSARIDFLTEDFCKEVVLGNPILNQVIVYEKKAIAALPALKRMREDIHFLNNIRNQEYDLVIDFFGNPRSAIMTWLSRAKQRIGYDYRIRRFAYTKVVKSRANQVHEAEWHLDAIEAIDVPIISKKLNFEVGRGSKMFAQTFWDENKLNGKTPVFAINFSAGWATKRWPLEHWAKVADHLVTKHKGQVILLWGPGEKEDALKLRKMIGSRTILLPETNLKQLAAILDKVDYMVTTDSGPMHIAAAMDTPCAAIFGPTNPELQGPYGNGHKIIRNNKLNCLACDLTSCSHTACLNDLTTSTVFEEVDEYIASHSA